MIALILALLALAGACAFARLHYLRFRRLGVPQRRKLPADSLPAATPFLNVLGSLIVYRLKTPNLSEAFYDDELVDKTEEFTMHAMLPDQEIIGNRIIFLTHISRSGTTLLCRMLEANGDVNTYREPVALIRLLRSATRGSCDARSISVGLIKRILQQLANHSHSVGKTTAVIKLPSAAADADLLQVLSECCPNAHKVFVSRSPEEVLLRVEATLRSLSASPGAAPHAPALSILQERYRTAVARASAVIHYDDIVGDARAVRRVCATLGVTNVSDDLVTRMMAIKNIHAKTGAPYIEVKVQGGP